MAGELCLCIVVIMTVTEIRLSCMKKIKVLPKAREILFLGYISSIICPSVVGVYESYFIFSVAFLPGMIAVAVRLIISYVGKMETVQLFLELHNGTTTDSAEGQEIDPTSANDNQKDPIFSACLYLMLALLGTFVIYAVMGIRKQNEKMEKSIQEKRVVKNIQAYKNTMMTIFMDYISFQDFLPNYGMTGLVACAVFSFHEGVDSIIKTKKHSSIHLFLFAFFAVWHNTNRLFRFL